MSALADLVLSLTMWVHQVFVTAAPAGSPVQDYFFQLMMPNPQVFKEAPHRSAALSAVQRCSVVQHVQKAHRRSRCAGRRHRSVGASSCACLRGAIKRAADARVGSDRHCLWLQQRQRRLGAQRRVCLRHTGLGSGMLRGLHAAHRGLRVRTAAHEGL